MTEASDRRKLGHMRPVWLLALPLLCALGACPEIDGAAAEVAWVLRDSRQRAAKCDSESLRTLDLSIAKVRLRIQAVDELGGLGEDLCEAGAVKGCEFSCRSLGGTTPFSIPLPPGQEFADYFFSLAPLSEDGTPIGPDVVAVPPPMRRTVRKGDLTDLGLWMLVIPAPEELIPP